MITTYLIPFSELIDRGLNERKQNILKDITKLLVDIINDRLIHAGAKNRPAWHFKQIHYKYQSKAYLVIITEGEGVPKG